MQSAKSPIFIISPFSNPLDRSNERIESEKEIFSHEAIFKIFSFSKGCPQLINTICDRALLTGYAQDISQLDHKVIQKCADELALHGEKEYNLEESATEGKKENHRSRDCEVHYRR